MKLPDVGGLVDALDDAGECGIFQTKGVIGG
jgi:hypothetical protein